MKVQPEERKCLIHISITHNIKMCTKFRDCTEEFYVHTQDIGSICDTRTLRICK